MVRTAAAANTAQAGPASPISARAMPTVAATDSATTTDACAYPVRRIVLAALVRICARVLPRVTTAPPPALFIQIAPAAMTAMISTGSSNAGRPRISAAKPSLTPATGRIAGLSIMMPAVHPAMIAAIPTTIQFSVDMWESVITTAPSPALPIANARQA